MNISRYEQLNGAKHTERANLCAHCENILAMVLTVEHRFYLSLTAVLGPSASPWSVDFISIGTKARGSSHPG